MALTRTDLLKALGFSPTPPTTFEGYLDQWDAVAQAAGLLKTLEMDMRKAIAQSVFPNPVEGTNTHTLPDGRKLKLTHKYTRSLDESQIESTRAAYMELNDRPVDFDDLLKVRYELATTAYRKLEVGTPASLTISQMITVKPSAPSLELK